MQKEKFDELDKKIINKMIELQNVKHADIAKELGIATATVNKRIHKLIKNDIIKGFVPIINTTKFGYPIVAIINIRLKYSTWEEALQKISQHKNVCAVYKVSGAYDAVAIAKCKAVEELDALTTYFLKIGLIERTNTSFVFNIVKEGLVPQIN